MSPTTPQVDSPARLWRHPLRLSLTLPLVLTLTAFCWWLWPEWSGNPDLSHGFFTPIIFLLLWQESRRAGPLRWLRTGPATGILCGLVMTGALGAFGLAGLLAASVGWEHDLISFLFGTSLVLLLAGSLTILSADSVRIIPFNWISLTAIGLWLLSVPLPTGTYQRLTLALQGFVSSGVIDSLQLLGIPARQHGNIIELAQSTVGVAEACSGIRSLLSCIYAGFFFAAWQVRRPLGRAVLILAAPALALVMNFSRSLGLTLLANNGVEIVGFWHDTTGVAILVLTAGLLAGLALRLGPRATTAPIETPPVSSPEFSPQPPPGSIRIWTAGLVVLMALAGLFAFFSRPAPTVPGPLVDLGALLPAAPAGWDVTTDLGSHEFFGVLKTDRLIERTYTTRRNGHPVDLAVYIAHWLPGQAPVSLVASHTPDACWPGTGWSPQPNPEPQRRLLIAGKELPLAEYRIFQNARSAPQHVWFWHLHAGKALDFQDPYSIPALLRLAWRHGFNREGEQYFIRISSTLRWEELSGEPLLAEIQSSLAPVGLIP